MDCSHGHHHHHHHLGIAEGMTPAHVRQLRLVMVLSIGYLALQFFGGLASGSLALMAEAGHKLGDTGVIGLALAAAWLSLRPASPTKTFGMERIEVLAALTNGVGLCGIAWMICSEAIERLQGHEHHVHGASMLWVSLLGLAINIVSAWILNQSKDTSLNVRVTFLHIMSDLMASVGSMVSALLILVFHWMWADTVLSFLIVLLVLKNAFHIIASACQVLLEAAPPEIDLPAVRTFLSQLEGVDSVHDLHVWSITTGKNALLAHVVVSPDLFSPQTVQRFEEALREKFAFCHITLQLEPVGFQEEPIPF